ncbi:MAG: ABC transporter permease [Phycisphaerae bacterium]|nr:ABC transporter permease [Phycisphaerae bacterium]
MTDAPSANPTPQDIVLDQDGPREPPRSYVRRVLGDTLARWGARLGVAWISILAALSVLAPFLASSHPIALKTTDGIWSSPLLRHLTAADVTLLVVAATALTLWFTGSWSIGRRVLVFLGILAVTIGLTLALVQPPSPIVYSQYRELEDAGKVEFILRAPIPYSPTDRLRDRSQPPVQGPSSEHWCGTEANGADVLSRMIHASRIAMAVGFIATGIAALIGILIGGVMGYFSGLVDLIGMRLVEIAESIPTLFLLLMFVAFFDRNLYMMMVIIGFTTWSGYARFIRAEFLKLRQQDFVLAGVACGLPLRSILFRHMLPNGLAPVLVSASFGVASAILYEAVLSFLGLGLVDEPSWGEMLNQATGAAGTFSWWLATFPGMAIFLTVFAYNLIGESLRDAIDPHLKKSSHL